jgi:chromosome partitioning protein
MNQKGGVGKTTTSVNLSSAIATLNKNVILIDLDPQGNATSGLGVDKKTLDRTIFDALTDESTFLSTLLPTPLEGLRISPSNSDLLAAEFHFSTQEQGKLYLKSALSRFFWSTSSHEQPDFVFIDCPPSLGQLTINAILASDAILIPVQCEYYALEGLTEIISSASMIRENFNRCLSLEGILLTMADRRLNLSQQVEEDIRNAYGDKVFESVIYRSVRISEAPSHGLPILLYDPNSSGALSYLNLAKEVIENEKKSAGAWPFRSSC